MIRRIGLIAAREFVTTVGNKRFLFGLLVMPAMIAIAGLVGPRIINARSPQIRGTVAVIDPTGQVLPDLRVALDPAIIAARRAENARRAVAQIAPGAAQAAASAAGSSTALAPIPALRVIERPPDSALEDAKTWLLAGAAENPDDRRLAVVAVNADAARRPEGKPDFGGYDLYVSSALDDNTEGIHHDALRQSLVSARVKAGNLDLPAFEATMRVDRPNSIIVAASGAQNRRTGLTRALPFIMVVLLFIGIMMGGQTLMTSTIEEKSSRVVEVLLAAVSPLELMAGKLFGQLGVGLLVMAIYVGLGLLALFQFAMLGLIDPPVVMYFFVFYLLSYLLFGALMSAIGAAVNQIADAQSLMGPVMLTLVTPYVLAPIISRAPNSTFAVAMSFVPPFNAFAIMARLTSYAPPPAWQVMLSIVASLAAAAAAIWFAGKVFKIGLLMHGKPPNFATLVRWARMA